MTGKTRRITVKVRRLPHGEGLPLPAYQTAGAAGADLIAALADDAPATIDPGHSIRIPTGLALELPKGTEAQVRPRSGLAAKHGVTVLNAPGTIDADYRGEVMVILINHGTVPFTIQRGDRIAQMIFAPVTRVRFGETTALSNTARGAGGFGSTGVAQRASSTVAKAKKRLPKSASRTQSRTQK
jgi:dUTP pyrophosphatase